jgi:hypothetical protein
MARSRTERTTVENVTPIRAENSGDAGSPDRDAKAGGGGDGGLDDLPSPQHGNITDLTRFADDDEDPVRSVTRRVRCALSRPDNFTRFRTWPDQDWWRIYHFLIRKNAGQSDALFLVDPSLLELDELEGRTKRKRLIPYVARSGSLGLWPIGVDDSNPYVSSALHICQLAINEWGCAVTQGREDGEYHYKEPNPKKNYGEPKWPEGLTLNELLTLAFSRDRLILSRNHPELVKLRDED